MALGTEPGIKCKKHVAISGMTDDMILKTLFICNPSRRGDAAMAMTNHSILGQYSPHLQPYNMYIYIHSYIDIYIYSKPLKDRIFGIFLEFIYVYIYNLFLSQTSGI
jgi:hypothetical protein